MRTTLRLAVVAAALGTTALVGSSPASAVECPTQSVYSSYAQACVPAEPVEDDEIVPNGAVTPTSLPFTGGEVALLAAVGGSVLVLGVGLVAAGRRRRSGAETA